MVQNRFVIIIILLFLISDTSFATVDWNLLDEDCADISGWNDFDTNGESTQVTFDSKSCFKFYVATAGASNDAQRSIDTGDLSGDYTFEVRLYLDKFGSNAIDEDDGVQIQVVGDTCEFAVDWGTLGLRIRDALQWNVIAGITIVEDEWHKWRFEVHNSQTDVDVYLDDVLMSSDEDCSAAVLNDEGKVIYWHYSDTMDEVLSYTDWMRLDTGVGIVHNDIGLRFYDGTNTIKIGTLPVGATHKLRFYNGSDTYGIPLVATDDPYASAIRIYDGSNVKALLNVD